MLRVYKGKKGVQQNAPKQLPPHLTALPSVPAPATTPVATTSSTQPIASTAGGGGIHPDRQRFLDQANGIKVGPKKVTNVQLQREVKIAADLAQKEQALALEKAEQEKVATAAAAVVADKPKKAATERQQQAADAKALRKKEKKDKKRGRTDEEVQELTQSVDSVMEMVEKTLPLPAIPSVDAKVNGEDAAPKSKKAKKDKTAAPQLAPIPTFLSTLVPTLLASTISLGELKSSVITQAVAAGYTSVEAETAFLAGIKVGGKKMKLTLEF